MPGRSPVSTLRVDFLAPESHGLPGRLGLTSAPGKWRDGLDPSSDTLLRDDLVRLRDHHGTRLLVTLTEELEMRKLGISRLLPTARRLGLRTLWFPIPDVSVPRDVEDAAPPVRRIVRAMRRGETVVVHCRGGLGRSGTIAACCLVALGRGAEEAIALVRAVRPGAVEIRAQEAFVTRFAREMPGGAAPAPRTAEDSRASGRNRLRPGPRPAGRGRPSAG